jgi:integrase
VTALIEPMIEPWVTKQQLADHLLVTRRWIEPQQHADLPYLRVGGLNRYRVSEVEGWLRERYTRRGATNAAQPGRHKPKWVGVVSYKGHRKWVSAPSMEAYTANEEKTLAELRKQVDNPARREVPTVLKFVGAEIHEDGRITMTWPDGQRAQNEAGRRDSSIRYLRDGLRPLIREFHDRRLDSFTRDEALTWALPKNANVQQSVRQFFNHALDRDLIQRNHFTRLGVSKRKRRVDRPDFEIITDEQYERLRRCARESRADDYGLVLEGAVLTVGEEAIRPGEIFALHRPELHFAENLIHVRRQIDLDSGKITWPKDDDGRWVVMSPAFREHVEKKMPRMGKVVDAKMGEIVFPAPQGGIHAAQLVVIALALSTRRRRDARSGLLRVEASRDSMDDRSCRGRRARPRSGNGGSDGRPR